MASETARNSFLELIEAAVTSARQRSASWPLRGGAAHHGPVEMYLRMGPQFRSTANKVASLQLSGEPIGPWAAERICSDFGQEYFRRTSLLGSDQGVFDQLWSDFVDEFENPKQLWRGIANLRQFFSTSLRADPSGFINLPLVDGISLRDRHSKNLSNLGFTDHVLAELDADWQKSPGGYPSLVLVVEDEVPKSPQNLEWLDQNVLVKATG